VETSKYCIFFGTNPDMFNLRIVFFLLLMGYGLTAFSQSRSKTIPADVKFFEDTLRIWTRFRDCGALGGYNELIKIYVRNDSVYFTYRKDTLNCKETDFTAPMLPYKLAESETMWVSKKKMAALRRYVHQLLDYKFNEVFSGNMGYTFEVRKMNYGLSINVYSDDSKLIKAYSLFKVKLLN
jgi:hypothetical protein